MHLYWGFVTTLDDLLSPGIFNFTFIDAGKYLRVFGCRQLYGFAVLYSSREHPFVL